MAGLSFFRKPAAFFSAASISMFSATCVCPCAPSDAPACPPRACSSPFQTECYTSRPIVTTHFEMTSETLGARRGDGDSFGVVLSAAGALSGAEASGAASFFAFFGFRFATCFCFLFFSFSIRFLASTSIFCFNRLRSSSRSLAPTRYPFRGNTTLGFG